jgi:chromosome segregation ATPase
MLAEDNTFTDASISQEEREEILEEINGIVTSNKIKYSSGNFKVKAKHKGYLFPVLWMVISALIIAGGIFGAGLFFGAREQAQIDSSRSQFEDSNNTAQAILQRAQADLENAEAALNDINSQLNNVAAELNAEREAFDSRLEEEQARLQAELDAELAAARAELESQNVSEAEIQNQLQALEQERNQAFQAQLQQFEQSARQELDARVAEFGARQQELQAELAQAQVEVQAREQEALAQQEALNAELASQNEQLAALEAEREAVALFETQLNGLLERVQLQVQVQDFAAAMSAIDGLDNLITTAVNNPNEGIRNIGLRQQDLLGALKATLETVIAQEAAGNDPRFELFKGLVAEAEALSDDGEKEAKLRQALGTVPEIGQMYATLNAIELNARVARLSSLNAQVQNLGSSGEREAAIATMVQGLLGDLINLPQGQTALTNLNTNLAALSESLSAPLSQTRTQLSSTQQELAGVEAQLVALETDLEQRVSAWQIERASLENTIAGLQGNGTDREAQLQSQVSALEDELAALRATASGDTTQITDLQDQIATLEEELTTLQAEKAIADQQLATLSTTLEENQALLAQVAGLTDTQLANEATITELENQITTLNTEKAAVESRLAELQAGLTSGESTVASEEYQNLLSDYQSVQSELEALTQTSSSQAEQITNLNSQIKALEAEKTNLESQMAELQGSVDSEEYQSLLEEYQTLQNAQESLTAEKTSLEEENAALSAQLDSLSGGSSELQEEISTLQSLLAEREQSMIELSEIQGRTDRMLSIFESAKATVFGALANPTTANLNRAKTELLRTFNSSEASSLFPDMAEAVDGLLNTEPNDVEIDPTPFKRLAYQEVLSFAQYLLGEAENASAIRDQVEEISRREATFKSLVDSIQALSERGSIEETVSTSNYELYGTIISAYGNKIIAEPITGSQATESQFVEIRSTGLLGGDSLALGAVIDVGEKRVIIEVTTQYEGKRAPSFGDAVYLAIP